MISVVRVTPLVGVTYQRQHKRYLYGHPLEVKMMFWNLPVTSVTYVFEVSVEVHVLLRNLIYLCHLKLA